LIKAPSFALRRLRQITMQANYFRKSCHPLAFFEVLSDI
jgi:hypothetical protein